MIGLIATMRVQDGKGEEFERLFGDLAAKVRAQETGNLLYRLCRSRTEPNTYKVLELYRDQDALKAHGASEHFKAAGPGLGGVLAGRPEIEYMDALGD